MKREGWFGLAVAGIALLVSAMFAWVVPVGVNPDEDAHRALVELMARDNRLVVFVPPPGRAPIPGPVLANIERETGWRELPEGQPSRDEAHQPPLYYALAALVRKGVGDASLPLRWISVLFQCATVWLVSNGIRELFPTRPWLAPGVAACVALLPVAAQLGGAISNDAAAHFLSAWFCLGCARLAGSGLDRGAAVRLGAVLGLGLLTKSTVLQLVPMLLVSAGIRSAGDWRRRGSAFGSVGIVLATGLSIAAPWFLRNVQLYGDPLARSIYAATGPNFAPEAIRALAGWSPMEYARQVGVRTFATIFYFLPPNLPLARFTGPPLPLAGVLALTIGGAAGAARAWRTGCLPAIERGPEAVLAIAPWVLVPFSVYFSATVFQAQGRYLHPAVVGISLVLVSGWSALMPRRPWLGAFLPAAGMGALAVAQLLGGGFTGGDIG